MGSCFSRWENEIEYSGWFDLPFDMRRSIIDVMDFQTKARFAQCSQECYEEVSQTRNFIRHVHIIDGREGGNRVIQIFAITEDEEWLFRISELSSGNIEVCWEMNNEIISRKTFEKSNPIDIVLLYFNDILTKNSKSLKYLAIFIDDFPYNQTNIRNLKCEDMRSLILCENKHGIDPILSGFVDLDTIYRFHRSVDIPNCQFDDLFRIKSKDRRLTNPVISLDDFDDFMKRFLIEEQMGEHFKLLEVNLEKYEENSKVFHEIIKKYTDSDGMIRDEETGQEKDWLFWRKSRKWRNREHIIGLNKHRLLCHTSEI